MRKNSLDRICILLSALALWLAVVTPVCALAADPTDESLEIKSYKGSGLKLPRFVSLGDSRVYMRNGPDKQYPVKWVYVKAGIPLEVFQEHETWRKVRDHDGQIGWINGPLLSAVRTALVETDEPLLVRDDPEETAAPVVRLADGVIVRVLKCRDLWCKVQKSEYEGWVLRRYLWGVYEGEEID